MPALAKKALILTFGLIFFSVGISFGESKQDKLPFAPGEKLSFRIIYFAMPAGRATFEVKKLVSLEGEESYHFVVTAKSSPVFALFYRVQDRLESWVDAASLLPYRFEKHQREGKYRNNETTFFDRENNLAVNVDADEGENFEEGTVVSVPPDVQDALSAFYHLRRQKLEVGKSVFINVNADEKNYKVEVKVLKKERLGRNGPQTILVQPILKHIELGGILEEKGGIYIWLTDDEKRIPLLIKARVIIGSLSIILVDKKLGEENGAEK